MLQQPFIQNPKLKPTLPLIISGILTFLAVGKGVFMIGWFCLVPMFVLIQRQEPIRSFMSGFIFGLSLAAIAFYWMIPGAERFTGSSILYGVIVYLLSAFLLALFFGLVVMAIDFLTLKNDTLLSAIANAVLSASIFCLGEFLLSFVATGMPWFGFHAGNAIAYNLWAIQPAAYWGVYGLTFIVVLVNYLIAVFYLRRQWKLFYLPISFFLAYMLSGYLILNDFNALRGSAKSFTTSILCENILPDIKWNEQTGNELVLRLLNLNRSSLNDKADLNLWSESTVPWTYRPDDDFVKEIISNIGPDSITTVIGINSDYGQNEVYNSVYCLAPDGSVKGRYDKQYLLSLIEKPAAGLIFPFLSSEGFIVEPGEQYNNPLQTPFGKAGIIICNEVTVPAAASTMVEKGAGFLFNLSNDGWFNDTYIVNLHFINARMRAVETRKDICVNSNNGISGLIKASGVIAVQLRDTEPFARKVTVEPNAEISFFTRHPHFFLIACSFVLFFFMAAKAMKYKHYLKRS